MPDKNLNIRASFLTAMFSLLGYVANCDGPLNRAEIKRIKFYMDKMQLTEDEQRRATQLLKIGISPEFNVQQALKEFREATTPKLIHILLVYLITIARADGFLKQKEMFVIQRIARELGYRSIVFNHLLKMLSTQDELYARTRGTAQEAPGTQNVYENPGASHQGKRPQGNQTHNSAAYENLDLQTAYVALGVTAEMTDDEIRLAYKKLASQFHPDKFHPDKLTSQEMSAESRHAATEKFKKIQAAYAFVKKYRALYAAN